MKIRITQGPPVYINGILHGHGDQLDMQHKPGFALDLVRKGYAEWVPGKVLVKLTNSCGYFIGNRPYGAGETVAVEPNTAAMLLLGNQCELVPEPQPVTPLKDFAATLNPITKDLPKLGKTELKNLCAALDSLHVAARQRLITILEGARG